MIDGKAKAIFGILGGGTTVAGGVAVVVYKTRNKEQNEETDKNTNEEEKIDENKNQEEIKEDIKEEIQLDIPTQQENIELINTNEGREPRPTTSSSQDTPLPPAAPQTPEAPKPNPPETPVTKPESEQAKPKEEEPKPKVTPQSTVTPAPKATEPAAKKETVQTTQPATPKITKTTTISNISPEIKKSGKIFETVKGTWTENKWGPFTLFKCSGDSCNEIPAFTQISFRFGRTSQELFSCKDLDDQKYTPFYYFNQSLSTNVEAKDLDWSKLERATGAKRTFGEYVVIKISEVDSCGGTIEKPQISNEAQSSVSYSWDEDNKYTNKLSVFLTHANNEVAQYEWQPIAPLRIDFDINSLKTELKQ